MSETLEEKVTRLEKWVSDLQASKYINCVYCGYRFGLETEVPASMADIHRDHMSGCVKHPMYELTLIKKLTEDEMSSVEIYSPNIAGPPYYAVDYKYWDYSVNINKNRDYSGNTTNYNGDTLLDCLQQAIKDKTERETTLVMNI